MQMAERENYDKMLMIIQSDLQRIMSKPDVQRELAKTGEIAQEKINYKIIESALQDISDSFQQLSRTLSSSQVRDAIKELSKFYTDPKLKQQLVMALGTIYQESRRAKSLEIGAQVLQRNMRALNQYGQALSQVDRDLASRLRQERSPAGTMTANQLFGQTVKTAAQQVNDLADECDVDFKCTF
jgi:Zn-dependent oligopeptidase